MAFSSVIAEAIMLIAVIICTSVFAATLMSKTVELKQDFSINLREAQNVLDSSLTIIYATYDSEQSCFKIYIKNTGSVPIFDIPSFSIIFGTYGKAKLYIYNDSKLPGTWYYEEFYSQDGILQPYEVICINIFNDTLIYNPCYVKIVTYNGVEVETIFNY